MKKIDDEESSFLTELDFEDNSIREAAFEFFECSICGFIDFLEEFNDGEELCKGCLNKIRR